MTKKTTKNLKMKTPKKTMNKDIIDKMVRNVEENQEKMEATMAKSVYENSAQQTCGLSAASRPSPLGLLNDIPRKTFSIQLVHKTLGCLTKNCYSQTELVEFIKELSFIDIYSLQIEYR